MVLAPGLELVLAEAPDALPGDFNDDGLVDFADFFLFVDNFARPAEAGDPFDLVPDGVIDFTDFFELVDLLGGLGAKAVALAGPLLGLPAEAELGDNYPNPFNSSTLIPFALPQAGPVRLEVFNLLGQRVRLLADGPRAAGSHRVAWDGRDERGRSLRSGVYFYRLKGAGFAAQRRLLLLR